MTQPEEIARGDAAIARAWSEGWLLDGELLRWAIGIDDGRLTVVLDIDPHPVRGIRPLQLTFVNVVEYGLYYHKDRHFYTIEDCKLLRESDGVYVSLDPDTSSPEPLNTDQDFVRASDVVAVWRSVSS